MSLEVVNTIATLGTFLVIAATAIAAIIQLRHMRSSNQIAALNELREAMAGPELEASRHFVATDLKSRLEDPAFRHQIVMRSATTDENRPLISKFNALGNFYEGLGLLVKARLVERKLVLELWSDVIVDNWASLALVTAMLRREAGDGLWESFEYLAVLSQDWLAGHPKGSYPSNMRRIQLKDEWLEADTQYAASLAPA